MNEKLYKVVVTFPNGRTKVFNKVRVLTNDPGFVELQSEKGGTVWTIIRNNVSMVQISDIPKMYQQNMGGFNHQEVEGYEYNEESEND